jgi:hypothetical protein
MPYSGIYRHVALVRTDFSEDRSPPSSKRRFRRNIPDDGILYSRHRENLKSCIALTAWAL